MTKRSITILFRVNSKTDDIIKRIHSEIRRKCDRPSAPSSKINRSFWMTLHHDDKLRKRVVEAVCKFIDDYDTSI